MAAEGTPAVIVAVAAGSRFSMAFESVAAAAPIVVPRVAPIEHGAS
jgi:hypothetical protein